MIEKTLLLRINGVIHRMTRAEIVYAVVFQDALTERQMKNARRCFPGIDNDIREEQEEFELWCEYISDEVQTEFKHIAEFELE